MIFVFNFRLVRKVHIHDALWAKTAKTAHQINVLKENCRIVRYRSAVWLWVRAMSRQGFTACIFPFVRPRFLPSPVILWLSLKLIYFPAMIVPVRSVIYRNKGEVDFAEMLNLCRYHHFFLSFFDIGTISMICVKIDFQRHACKVKKRKTWSWFGSRLWMFENSLRT